MTRLPTLSARKIIQGLEKAGCVLRRQTGSHFIMKHPAKRLRTSVPIHSRDVNRSLMKLILKQAGMTEEEFGRLL
jgi:predicted RNA binding protein YcfA (HicA-like mRNA interferase family)